MLIRPNFTQKELECPCCKMMNATDELLDKLQDLRNHFDKPIIVNSCCRCEERNQDQGGAGSSKHLTGDAADLKINHLDTGERKMFAKLCLEIFPYCRFYPNHVHVDVRDYEGFSVGGY